MSIRFLLHLFLFGSSLEGSRYFASCLFQALESMVPKDLAVGQPVKMRKEDRSELVLAHEQGETRLLRGDGRTELADYLSCIFGGPPCHALGPFERIVLYIFQNPGFCEFLQGKREISASYCQHFGHNLRFPPLASQG